MYYTLVGLNGNAFNLMGYTARAMEVAYKNTGNSDYNQDHIDEFYGNAMSGDYSHLVCVCQDMIDKINKELGLKEPEYEESIEDEM